PRAEHAEGPRKGRAGPDGAGGEEGLDDVQSPADPARPPRMPFAPAVLRKLHAGRVLPQDRRRVVPYRLWFVSGSQTLFGNPSGQTPFGESVPQPRNRVSPTPFPNRVWERGSK